MGIGCGGAGQPDPERFELQGVAVRDGGLLGHRPGGDRGQPFAGAAGGRNADRSGRGYPRRGGNGNPPDRPHWGLGNRVLKVAPESV